MIQVSIKSGFNCSIKGPIHTGKNTLKESVMLDIDKNNASQTCSQYQNQSFVFHQSILSDDISSLKMTLNHLIDSDDRNTKLKKSQKCHQITKFVFVIYIEQHQNPENHRSVINLLKHTQNHGCYWLSSKDKLSYTKYQLKSTNVLIIEDIDDCSSISMDQHQACRYPKETWSSFNNMILIGSISNTVDAFQTIVEKMLPNQYKRELLIIVRISRMVAATCRLPLFALLKTIKLALAISENAQDFLLCWTFALKCVTTLSDEAKKETIKILTDECVSSEYQSSKNENFVQTFKALLSGDQIFPTISEASPSIPIKKLVSDALQTFKAADSQNKSLINDDLFLKAENASMKKIEQNLLSASLSLLKNPEEIFVNESIHILKYLPSETLLIDGNDDDFEAESLIMWISKSQSWSFFSFNYDEKPFLLPEWRQRLQSIIRHIVEHRSTVVLFIHFNPYISIDWNKNIRQLLHSKNVADILNLEDFITFILNSNELSSTTRNSQYLSQNDLKESTNNLSNNIISSSNLPDNRIEFQTFVASLCKECIKIVLCTKMGDDIPMWLRRCVVVKKNNVIDQADQIDYLALLKSVAPKSTLTSNSTLMDPYIECDSERMEKLINHYWYLFSEKRTLNSINTKFVSPQRQYLRFCGFRNLIQNMIFCQQSYHQNYYEILQQGLNKCEEYQSCHTALIRERDEELIQQEIFEKEIKDILFLINKLETEKTALKNDLAQLQNKIELYQKEGTILRDIIDQELGAAGPQLIEAMKCVESLTKNDMYEIKAMQNPPPAALVVLVSVGILFRVSFGANIGMNQNTVTDDTDDLEVAKRLISDNRFIHIISTFDRDNISSKTLTKLETFTKKPEFNSTSLQQVSKPIAALGNWVLAIYRYQRIMLTIQPKKNALNECEIQTKSTENIKIEKFNLASSKENTISIFKGKLDEFVATKNNKGQNLLASEQRVKISTILLTVTIKPLQVKWKQDLNDLISWRQHVIVAIILTALNVSLGSYVCQDTIWRQYFDSYHLNVLENFHKNMWQNLVPQIYSFLWPGCLERLFNVGIDLQNHLYDKTFGSILRQRLSPEWRILRSEYNWLLNILRICIGVNQVTTFSTSDPNLTTSILNLLSQPAQLCILVTDHVLDESLYQLIYAWKQQISLRKISLDDKCVTKKINFKDVSYEIHSDFTIYWVSDIDQNVCQQNIPPRLNFEMDTDEIDISFNILDHLILRRLASIHSADSTNKLQQLYSDNQSILVQKKVVENIFNNILKTFQMQDIGSELTNLKVTDVYKKVEETHKVSQYLMQGISCENYLKIFELETTTVGNNVSKDSK